MRPVKLKKCGVGMKIPLCCMPVLWLFHTHTQISKFGLIAVIAELLSSDEYSKQTT